MVDVIIIGAGPAGLSAGLFARSYGLKTAIIGEVIGGQFSLAQMAFNYPGVASVTGKGWIDAMVNQLKEAGIEVAQKKVASSKQLFDSAQDKQVVRENGENYFNITCTDGIQYECRSIIFTTGNKKRRPTYSGDILAQSLGVNVLNGYITVDEQFATNIPGIFAAGDCLGYPQALEQLVVVCGQGVKAAASAYAYLRGSKPPIAWGKASILRI